jgi:hypothetical protein
MGVFDWIEEEATAVSGGEFPWPGADGVGKPVYKGTFAVTIGDAIAGIIGQRQTHIFGPDIKLVVDVEDMLANLVEKIPGMAPLSPMMGALAGIGGNVGCYYGSNISFTYVGPKVDIRRAPEMKKTSGTIFGDAQYDGPTHTLFADTLAKAAAAAGPAGAAAAPPTPGKLAKLKPFVTYENSCKLLVTGLSTILAAATAGIEIAMRVKYSQFGKSAPPGSAKEEADKFKETVEGYGETPELLDSLLYTMPPRIMKFIQIVEFGTHYFDYVKHFSTGSLEYFHEVKRRADLAERQIANGAYSAANRQIAGILRDVVVYARWAVGILLTLAYAILMLALLAAVIGVLVELVRWAAGVAR